MNIHEDSNFQTATDQLREASFRRDEAAEEFMFRFAQALASGPMRRHGVLDFLIEMRLTDPLAWWLQVAVIHEELHELVTDEPDPQTISAAELVEALLPVFGPNLKERR